MLRTLVYSDIFDFPLTLEELFLYLEKYSVASMELLAELSLEDISQVEYDNDFYFLRGRKNLVEERRRRDKWSRDKLRRAKAIARRLGSLPGIRLVGVTGAVAAGNSEQDDDIDLLLITAPGRVWLARLFEKITTELMGVRRRPSDQPGEAKDKVCPNVYLDSRNLRLPHQDLFTAREIAQMVVVYNEKETYEQFLSANAWVKGFLPNWWRESLELSRSDSSGKDLSGSRFGSTSKSMPPFGLVSDFFEELAKRIQLKYMSGKRTTETVTDTLLMFHPQDQRERVLKEFQMSLRRFQVKK